MAQLLWQVSLPLLLAFFLGWFLKSLITSRTMAQLRSALSDAQADAMRREAEVVTLGSRLQNSGATAPETARLRSILTAKDQEIENLRGQLRRALEESTDTVTSAAAQVEQLDRVHSAALGEREAEISRLRREVDLQKLEVTRLSTFVQTLEPLSMQLSEAERELTASVDAKNSEIARLTAQVQQLEAAMSASGIIAAVEPAGDMRSEIARLEEALAAREDEVRRLTILARDLERALRTAASGDRLRQGEPEVRAADPAAAQHELHAAVNGSRIDFLEGTAELEPASRPVLDSIASVLARYPGLPVEISGHTEEGPDFWFYYELSRRRALAVKEYLAAKGVPGSALTETGCGQTRPIADNSTPEGRRSNRRIEFRVATELLSAREIARAAAATR